MPSGGRDNVDQTKAQCPNYDTCGGSVLAQLQVEQLMSRPAAL